MRFAAVATTNQQTADAAARFFGVPRGYRSGLDLLRADDIDLVTVATRVTDHRDLVLAAIAAGKHVYCEWPLGRNLAETQEMASAARAAGVHTAIGLQLRGSPVVRRAKELIQAHAIGRVLSVHAYAATAGFGPVVPEPYVYLEDPRNFANLVTIQGAHTIDLVIAVVGALHDVSALATAQYPEILAGEKRSKQPRSTFDHLLLQGRFVQGATLSVEVAGGRPPETPFYLEIIGETGSLRLDGGAPRGFQSGRVALTLNGTRQRVDEGEFAALPDSAANVAGVYAAMLGDITHGTYAVAGFDHAVQLTQLMTDVLSSSLNGVRTAATNWPLR